MCAHRAGASALEIEGAHDGVGVAHVDDEEHEGDCSMSEFRRPPSDRARRTARVEAAIDAIAAGLAAANRRADMTQDARASARSLVSLVPHRSPLAQEAPPPPIVAAAARRTAIRRRRTCSRRRRRRPRTSSCAPTTRSSSAASASSASATSSTSRARCSSPPAGVGVRASSVVGPYLQVDDTFSRDWSDPPRASTSSTACCRRPASCSPSSAPPLWQDLRRRARMPIQERRVAIRSTPNGLAVTF